MEASTDPQALLTSMRTVAAAERQRLLTEARAKAEDILAAADQEVSEIQTDARSRATHTVDVETLRAQSVLQTQRRQSVQRYKQILLQEAFDAAAEELNRLPTTKAYGSHLARLITEAVNALGPQASCTVAAADKTLAQKALSSFPQVILTSADLPRGTVEVLSPDKRRRIDNSLASRLQRVQTHHLDAVATILFSDQENG